MQDHIEHLSHPRQVLETLRADRTVVGRFNDWLADHIVGWAGTMAFFYLLCATLVVWPAWQAQLGERAFDPYPYQFLFFILGGIMQSLFVPTMLVAANRAAQRDRVKDEADHRAWKHLYDVNEEQLERLRAISRGMNL